MKTIFDQIAQTLAVSQKILILSHNKPDGDTLGANLALRLHLQSQGKSVTSACADSIPDQLQFLPDSESFKKEFLLEDYDTIILVDIAAKHLIKFYEIYPELERTRKPKINFDHHLSNDNLGNLNAIDPNETSTTILIYKFFQSQQIAITPEIATCILNGIYTDTGSFVHTNTKPETMRIASELIKLGADARLIAKNNFKQISINKLKLMGEVLSDVQFDRENRKIISGVKSETMRAYSATSEDLTGVVDFLNSVPDTTYTVLYTEDNKGGVKASLRTRNDEVNVAKIAESYGGGGHSKAAGYRVPGRLSKKVSWEITPINNI